MIDLSTYADNDLISIEELRAKFGKLDNRAIHRAVERKEIPPGMRIMKGEYWMAGPLRKFMEMIHTNSIKDYEKKMAKAS